MHSRGSAGTAAAPSPAAAPAALIQCLGAPPSRRRPKTSRRRSSAKAASVVMAYLNTRGQGASQRTRVWVVVQVGLQPCPMRRPGHVGCKAARLGLGPAAHRGLCARTARVLCCCCIGQAGVESSSQPQTHMPSFSQGSGMGPRLPATASATAATAARNHTLSSLLAALGWSRVLVAAIRLRGQGAGPRSEHQRGCHRGRVALCAPAGLQPCVARAGGHVRDLPRAGARAGARSPPGRGDEGGRHISTAQGAVQGAGVGDQAVTEQGGGVHRGVSQECLACSRVHRHAVGWAQRAGWGRGASCGGRAAGGGRIGRHAAVNIVMAPHPTMSWRGSAKPEALPPLRLRTTVPGSGCGRRWGLRHAAAGA